MKSDVELRPFSRKMCMFRTVAECKQEGYGITCKFMHSHEQDMGEERIRAEAAHNMSNLRKSRRIDRQEAADNGPTSSWMDSAHMMDQAGNDAQSAHHEALMSQHPIELLWSKHEKHREVKRLLAEMEAIDVEIPHQLNKYDGGTQEISFSNRIFCAEHISHEILELRKLVRTFCGPLFSVALCLL